MIDYDVLYERKKKLAAKYVVMAEKPMTAENQRVTDHILAEICSIHAMLGAEVAEHHAARHSEIAEADFCHGICETDVDREMDRILKTKDRATMDKLSLVLSEHFKGVENFSPSMYSCLLRKLKAVS